MSDSRQRLRVEGERLVGRCNPAELPFETTGELPALDAVFGQERAVRAIEFALGMDARGYNLYAAGPDGFGKATIVESFLRRRAGQLPAPPDWVYVHNFADPDRPVGIRLPAGQGRAFAAQVQETVEASTRELRQAFESDSYAQQHAGFAQRLEQRRGVLLERLTARALELGFFLQMTPQGISSAPIRDGHPITDQEFVALSTSERERIQAASKELERGVQETMLEVRALERGAQDELRALDDQVAAFAIEHLFQSLLERYADYEEIARFVGALRDDLQRNRERAQHQHAQVPPQLAAMLGQTGQQALELRRYEVNVYVTHDEHAGAPVIVERHPTYYNLLGRIDYAGQLGTMVTDHTLIKAGSLARAAGGFLVVRIRDLIMNSQAYEGLKRALSSGEVAVENLGESLGMVPTLGLRPEPMPARVKVVIIGDAELYAALFRFDPDFRDLFRVKADFELDFERSRDNVLGLASVVRNQCELGSLRHFDREAVARLIEHSSRMVGDQRRLSGNLGTFTDLIHEANFWAEAAEEETVRRKHVERALEEREYRSSLLRDRIQQMIDDGSLLIDTEQSITGQINALSVYDLGDFTFGRPSRITCVVAAGHGAIVNVERETNMAGPIHNKGFLILRGFLADRFGGKANAVNASLTFEQLYGEIDGDSASSTEIYALLSALSGMSIDQGIAVTGSVSQRGEVQPIGGATAKIEGFYEVCRARGLSGRQGVMIPRANVPNVTLRPEVAQAVAEGRFHVWAAGTIEEGIELLTGMPAGTRAEDGRYPEGTLYRLVEDQLDAFYHQLANHKEVGAPAVTRLIAPPPPAPAPPAGIPPPPPPPPTRVQRE
ncbi:MAG: ATP-binding protein [Dehalococcoidia bacterium]|nr:ATP-binding protein [Dehalococcoidia bacterium]